MGAEGGKRRPRGPGCVILALRDMYAHQVLSGSKKLNDLKRLAYRCSKQKKITSPRPLAPPAFSKNRTERDRSPSGRPRRYPENFTSGIKASR